MTLFRRRRLLAFATACLLVFQLVLTPVGLSQRRAVQPAPRQRPRLIVGIMIDQFREDYLVRFRDQFVPGGLARLLQDGAFFSNAHYTHVPTYTACGHATFMSGATPAMHGIIGNEWWDRETNKRITSVSDDKVTLLGPGNAGATGSSPRRLLGSTIGDELRLSTGAQSKVIGIALKDRSAILPVGKRPTAAYWFDEKNGGFITSNYYVPDLPDWVKKFSTENKPEAYFGRKWERLLPEAAYARSRPDNAPEEKSAYGNVFPYTINGGETKPGPRFFTQFSLTPFANEFTLAFAKAAIENEGLGADAVPDLLTISLSANDLLGHTFGPYSQEVQDMTLRTDRQLAEFFSYLDRKIGMSNVIIVLSADHGVAPIPEMVAAMGFGGRISLRAVPAEVEKALTSRYGQGEWVKQFVNGNIYLDEGLLESKKIDAKTAESVACEAVEKIQGMAACYKRSDIIIGQLPHNRITDAVVRGFHPARSGNLIVVPEPYWFFGELMGTTHGTPYAYDTHVPVIFLGPGFVRGEYMTESSPADIAPTLARVLDLTPPSTYVGRVLTEALERR
jgi:predicted AlkP superfamily pyrophosphatase or phosphodiesterase